MSVSGFSVHRPVFVVMATLIVCVIGGVALPLPSLPKIPTTSVPAALVVTDGAEIDRVSGVNRPLCASMGAVWLTPL